MTNFNVSPIYDPNLRMFVTTDPAHADVFNAVSQQLLNNDAYLFSKIGTVFTDVTAFGAKGDFTLDANGKPPKDDVLNAVKDDSVAIQKALDLCRDEGGGTVYFPVGVYAIKSPLTVYKNTRVLMENGAVIVRNAIMGYLFTNGIAGATYNGYQGNGNIIFQGGRMEGNIKNYFQRFNFISIGHSQNVLIENVEFDDIIHYHAIEINSTKNCTIRNCVFDGFVIETAYQTDRRSEALQFDGAYGADEFGSFGAYDNTTCRDILVTGCTFRNWDRGVGSHTSKTGYHHHNFRIIGNHFEGLTGEGIITCMWDGCVIANNTFEDMRKAVYVRVKDSTNVTRGYVIANNTMLNFHKDDSARHAIHIMGTLQNGVSTARQIEEVVVYGNTIRDSAQTCIYISDINKLTVSNNTINGSAGGGIYLTNCDQGLILGNQLSDCVGATGVYLATSKYISCNSNFIYNCADDGIVLMDSDFCSIVGNNIRKVNTSGGQNCFIYVAGSSTDNIVSSNNMSEGSPYYGIWVTSTCARNNVVANKLGGYIFNDNASSFSYANG